jgi:hypothetical protein
MKGSIMSTTKAGLVFFLLGWLATCCLFLLMGAENASRTPLPRYTVSWVPPGLLVTDNQTNTFYIYVNNLEGGSCRLTYSLDLTQTGKKELSGNLIVKKDTDGAK